MVIRSGLASCSIEYCLRKTSRPCGADTTTVTGATASPIPCSGIWNSPSVGQSCPRPRRNRQLVVVDLEDPRQRDVDGVAGDRPGGIARA